jgi:succinyl-diaminopimelate desuccinylase
MSSKNLNDEEKTILDNINESEIIEYCKKLVATPSVFGSEHEISDLLAHDLASFGFKVTQVPVEGCGPCVVAATDGSQSAHLIFNGHMDTVEVCEGWTKNPFEPVIEDGKLFGLGSVDMKGGLTAIIMAAKALIQSDVKLRKSFAVHCVSDEEGWSRGTATLINKGFYKESKYCIVGEPSNLSRLRNARRAQCLVDIIVHGKSTHGAEPENGINAIYIASKVVQSLSNFPEKVHPRILDYKLRPLKTSTCVLKIEGGSDALRVPDKCVIRVDRHVLPGTPVANGLSEIKEYLKENLDADTFSRLTFTFTPRPTPPYEAFETDPNSELVKTLVEVSKVFGYDPNMVAGHSVADDCLIATKCKIPVVSYGPSGDITSNASARAHEADEYVYIDQVIDATKIYAITAYRLLK